MNSEWKTTLKINVILKKPVEINGKKQKLFVDNN